MRKIKILAHKYKVIYDDTWTDNNSGCPATFNSKLGTIRIDDSEHYEVSKIEECLLHEIFEAIDFHLQLKINHDVLSALCEGVYCVLKENNLIKSLILK